MKTEKPVFRPRKHSPLYQMYQRYDELVHMRAMHLTRHAAITDGRSSMDIEFENSTVIVLTELIKKDHAALLDLAQDVGPVWEWMTSIRGLGDGTIAARLLALIDDIGRFSTISKLWRASGYAVIDGHREYNTAGETSHYDSRLKSTVWMVGDQFVRQQTSPYVEIYYQEKARQRELHPEPWCKICDHAATKKGLSWRCSTNEKHPILWIPAHVDAMARRKMVKIFLQHLWLVWRQTEGLPINEPYVQAILGHVDIVPPPNYDPSQFLVQV